MRPPDPRVSGCFGAIPGFISPCALFFFCPRRSARFIALPLFPALENKKTHYGIRPQWVEVRRALA